MCITEGQLRKYFMGRADRMWTTGLPSLFYTFFFARWSQMVLTQCDVNSTKKRTSGMSNCESCKGGHMSPRPLQMLIVFHGGSVPIEVQTELSFVVASLSFYSAHVSVDEPLYMFLLFFGDQCACFVQSVSHPRTESHMFLQKLLLR